MEILFSALSQFVEVPADTVLAYFFAMCAGILVNWMWKCRRENINPVAYWTSNKSSTVYSLLGALSAFIVTIVMEPNLGKSTYFAIGIACDSMLNKLPLPLNVQNAMAEAEEKIYEQERIIQSVAAGDDDVLNQLRESENRADDTDSDTEVGRDRVAG